MSFGNGERRLPLETAPVGTLFDRFELAGYFPQGRIADKRVLFPLAGLQDVYVLRRR